MSVHKAHHAYNDSFTATPKGHASNALPNAANNPNTTKTHDVRTHYTNPNTSAHEKPANTFRIYSKTLSRLTKVPRDSTLKPNTIHLSSAKSPQITISYSPIRSGRQKSTKIAQIHQTPTLSTITCSASSEPQQIYCAHSCSRISRKACLRVTRSKRSMYNRPSK